MIHPKTIIESNHPSVVHVFGGNFWCDLNMKKTCC